MAEPIAVRRGVPGDAPRLAAFAARSFAETYGAANQPEHLAAHLTQAYGPAQQAGELSDADYLTLLIDGTDDLVAFAQLRRRVPPLHLEPLPPVEVYRFYVDRPWQGRGVARRLMDAVMDAGRGLGAEMLWLGVWERNPRAIAFYQKCGFRIVGQQDFFVGPDRQRDFVMTVRLPCGPASPGDT